MKLSKIMQEWKFYTYMERVNRQVDLYYLGTLFNNFKEVKKIIYFLYKIIFYIYIFFFYFYIYIYFYIQGVKACKSEKDMKSL